MKYKMLYTVNVKLKKWLLNKKNNWKPPDVPLIWWSFNFEGAR